MIYQTMLSLLEINTLLLTCIFTEIAKTLVISNVYIYYF